MPKAKIIIIDESYEGNQGSLQILLQSLDAERVPMRFCADAFKQAKINSDEVAAILINLDAPEVDRTNFANSLQQIEIMCQVPLILIGSNQQDERLEQALECGPIDFIQKPLNAALLRSKANLLLSLWHLRFEQQRSNKQPQANQLTTQQAMKQEAADCLPTKTELSDKLNELIYRSTRYDYSSAVICIALDDFDHVNQHYGRRTGEQLLSKLSATFNSMVRQTDFVTRIDGAKFIVLITDIDGSTSLITKIESLLYHATQPIKIEQHQLVVGASVGAAIFPDQGRSAKTLLHNAEQAMLLAKKQDSHRFHFFSEEINQRAHRQSALQDNLRKALPDNEFTVFYQPIIEIASGRVIAAESLLRWNSQALGQVRPSEFIPAAECAGLIPDLGCWIIRKAIATGADWLEKYKIQLRMTVNASPLQLLNSQLCKTIQQQLDKYGWDPDSIEVEITEAILRDESVSVAACLEEIKLSGVRLSVDDFGTGFSALGSLKKHSIDTVKIDRSLVMDLPGHKESASLVQAIIAMAHELDIEVIAEGVETRQQWDFLRALNCDFAQGYYFGKPMPRDEFEDLLIIRGFPNALTFNDQAKPLLGENKRPRNG